MRDIKDKWIEEHCKHNWFKQSKEKVHTNFYCLT